MAGPPFDAVLVISFGGPRGRSEIRPFLQNVLRGRRIPPARIEEVALHYNLFGGLSPLTELTLRQAQGLQDRLASEGPHVPVYVGMRNWAPLIEETLREMARQGTRRAVGFILAPHRSYSSCMQYRLNVLEAQCALRASGLVPPEITYVGDWHTHAKFIAANAQHLREALERLPQSAQREARVLFTAHSVPCAMAEQYHYPDQIRESAAAVASKAGITSWDVVYQSRSGRPEDPWLGPDIVEYLRNLGPSGMDAVVVAPIGFVCDHIEVLYDLDHQAAGAAREIGVTMSRAETVNDDPLFIDMMADVVRATWSRYANGRPLPIRVSDSVPRELPPPVRPK
ncbi:MAG: ferrochelatase [Acidobacteria bacterium]|nr:ferrochelatase [Acidobacteriota bacterium]